jgi:hypothetical protein
MSLEYWAPTRTTSKLTRDAGEIVVQALNDKGNYSGSFLAIGQKSSKN